MKTITVEVPDRTEFIPFSRTDPGMTLRDYFAARAMQAFITQPERPGDTELAKWAYGMADAMIEEREKGKK